MKKIETYHEINLFNNTRQYIESLKRIYHYQDTPENDNNFANICAFINKVDHTISQTKKLEIKR